MPASPDRPIEPTADAAAVRLGTLDAGAMAHLVRGSVIDLGGAKVHWWVRGPRRWHDPAVEASRRVRRVDGAPVVRTTIRLPAGDLAVVVGAVVDGTGIASVAIEVANPTSDPIAVAFVLEAAEPIEISTQALATETVTLHVGRPARASAAAIDAASAFASIVATDPQHLAPGTVAPGAAVLVLPVPHSATASAVVGATQRDRDATAQVARAATQLGAGGRRLAAGWQRVLEDCPVIDWGDDRAARWRAAVADALLGPDGADPDVVDLTTSLVALGRLGELDAADPWIDVLLARQRVTGAVRAHDVVAATASLLDVAAALWSGGLNPTGASRLLGPVASAVGWLSARRRRGAVEAAGAPVAAALARVVPFLVANGQTDLAGELAEWVGRLGWTGSATAERSKSDDRRGVPVALDAVVAETARGLDLARGWGADLAGLPIEVHRVPTRWGVVSWAVRWHGERPALLHEVRPWPERTDAAPRWTASRLDETWHATGGDSEALLAPMSRDLAARGAVRS